MARKEQTKGKLSLLQRIGEGLEKVLICKVYIEGGYIEADSLRQSNLVPMLASTLSVSRFSEPNTQPLAG